MGIQRAWAASGKEQNSGKDLATEYVLATCWTLDRPRSFTVHDVSVTHFVYSSNAHPPGDGFYSYWHPKYSKKCSCALEIEGNKHIKVGCIKQEPVCI